jgi:hypothetical protein
MNHQAEVSIEGTSAANGRIGLHMNAQVRVVVPLTATFGGPPPPAKPMKVDSSKVTVVKKS